MPDAVFVDAGRRFRCFSASQILANQLIYIIIHAIEPVVCGGVTAIYVVFRGAAVFDTPSSIITLGC
jgi:hypothetical protein